MANRSVWRRMSAASMALAVLGLVAAACGSAPAESSAPAPTTVPAEPRAGGQLRIGLAAETDSFNPYTGQWSQSSYNVANAIFEPLMATDELGIAHPYLAEDIVPNGDFTAWTITVRPDISFHNGEPFDAAALAKNLEKARTSGLTAQVFTPVTGVQVVDGRTVQVTMSLPWATFPATLAMQSGYMAAPAMLDDPAGANATPIGTGPFKFVERVRDATLTTTRNESYWRTGPNGEQLPYLEAIEFRIIADGASRGNALDAADIDAMDVVTPDLYQAQQHAAEQGEVEILTSEGGENDETVVALNTSKPPFDDPTAREAVTLAVDQQRVSEIAYGGAFPGAWGMFDESSPYYISKEEAGYPEPDPDRARELAAAYETAHGEPLAFEVLIPSDPEYLSIAQAVQEDLREVGISAELRAVQQAELIRTVVVTGDYEASGFLLRSAPSPDQAYIFLATKANPSGLSLNFTRFDDPKLVAAMDEFRAARDPEARKAALRTAQQQLAANKQMLFLVHARNAFVWRHGVHGFGATTYPGTDRIAHAPYASTPFYSEVWVEEAG